MAENPTAFQSHLQSIMLRQRLLAVGAVFHCCKAYNSHIAYQKVEVRFLRGNAVALPGSNWLTNSAQS